MQEGNGAEVSEQEKPKSSNENQNLEVEVRGTLGFIEERSHIVEAIANEVIARYSNELDEFVVTVKRYLDDIKKAAESGTHIEYSDMALDMQIIKLPVLMYFAASAAEDMALRMAVSQSHYLEVWNEAYQKAMGTIPDKKAQADVAAATQQMTTEIQKCIHKKLKTKIEQADNIYSALKKVMSRRISIMELQRRDLARLAGGDYEKGGE